MKKTRIFSTMLATVICMASLPAINVFAANQQRTTTLDLTVAGFQNDQKTRAGAGTQQLLLLHLTMLIFRRRKSLVSLLTEKKLLI